MIRLLERRAYTRQEMSEITGYKQDNNFLKNVKRALDKWGYGYEIPRRGDIIITRLPTSPVERLQELMRRHLGLDRQIDALPFACYFHLMLSDETAASMPWATRELILRERYGNNLFENPDIKQDSVEKKLQRWHARLIKVGFFCPDKGLSSRTLWRTEKVEGEKWQTRVDTDDEGYAAYKARRSELLRLYANVDKPWDMTLRQLWAEFKCCYYYCAYTYINAFYWDDLAEMISLTTEIVEGLIINKEGR